MLDPFAIVAMVALATTVIAVIPLLRVISNANRQAKLRNNGMEAIAVVVKKAYRKDAGFGDCEQIIRYEFSVGTSALRLRGEILGYESQFREIREGDRIAIRYFAAEPAVNLPADCLGIVTKTPDICAASSLDGLRT